MSKITIINLNIKINVRKTAEDARMVVNVEIDILDKLLVKVMNASMKPECFLHLAQKY